MLKKFFVWLLATVFLATASFAQAQQAVKVPRVGLLFSGSRSANSADIDAFRDSLRELGYTEGQNILLEFRFGEGELGRLANLASELLQLKVDIILTGGTQTTRAAKKATSAIPIVVGEAGDLVAAGLVASLAQPGGNVTGSTRISTDLSGKRLEILKEAVSKMSRVAVLSSSATAVLDRVEVKEMEGVARHLGVKLQTVDVKDPKEFQGAFAAMVREHAGGVIILQGSFTTFHRRQLIELALKNRLPSMCEGLLFTEAGCLMSYGPDVRYLWRRAAVFVDKILKGRTPADLPVEQPMKFELIINLKTAKQLGLTIPQWTLMKADRVIR